MLTILVMPVLLAGCSASRVSESSRRQISSDWDAPATRQVERFPGRASSALAFCAPVTRGNPALDLWREERQPGAFVGYESATASHLWVRTDDRQSFGPWYGWGPGYGYGRGGSWSADRYDRRSVTVEERTRIR